MASCLRYVGSVYSACASAAARSRALTRVALLLGSGRIPPWLAHAAVAATDVHAARANDVSRHDDCDDRSRRTPWADAPLTARLVLADGTVIAGHGLGATGSAVGEVCFNTAMTGYQEILTDPSYAGQIITFTFPHIGNVGTNDEDTETSNLAVALGRARLRAARRHHRARRTIAPPSTSTTG